MNSFEKGFIKRAMECGCNELQAKEILKKAILIPSIIGAGIGMANKPKGKGNVESGLRGAGVGASTDIGAALGGIGGGVLGAGSGHLLANLLNFSENNTDAASGVGMLGGGLAGLGLGGYGGYRLGKDLLWYGDKNKEKKAGWISTHHNGKPMKFDAGSKNTWKIMRDANFNVEEAAKRLQAKGLMKDANLLDVLKQHNPIKGIGDGLGAIGQVASNIYHRPDDVAVRGQLEMLNQNPPLPYIDAARHGGPKAFFNKGVAQ